MVGNVKGLTSNEAKIRLEKYGKNILPEKRPVSSIGLFLSQLKNPLVYILLVAGITTIFLGDYSDTTIIFFVVLVNSVLGFVQEKKASSALQALKAMVHPTADVIRDGREVRISVEDIVPGDVVEIESGEKIPADGKLIYSNRLFVEEAILTGESMPVDKEAGKMVFRGTITASGEGLFEVTATGANTEMGKIAASIQKPHEDTPLTRQLKTFSKQLTVLVLILTAFVFIVGVISGMEIVEMFKTSVALAVSSIPEGLLIALTVVLAIGMQRILKKKGLVRNLVSAETLGGVTTICVDKTGTLTYGKLKVYKEYGEVEDVCLQHFASSEDPIMVAAKDWLKTNSVHFKDIGEKFNRECKIIDHIPFTPQNRFYATLVEHKDKNKEVYVNGAPEHLLDWSTLDVKTQDGVRKIIEDATKEGKRVIGMAKKDVPESLKKMSENDVRGNLEWVGLLVFTDPVRKGVSEALEQTKQAGIKTILITGDFSDTAIAVMKELKMDVNKEGIITGSELEGMSVDALAKKIKDLHINKNEVTIFARTKPEQKLKVIEALKKNKEVVAMMGDGVNDAPALHKADIGVVVGDASDVAKESADLILLDSSFQTIVATVREGRGIFDNIRKIILYLLSDSFEEIVAVVGTIILRLPLPVTAAQILWINIISDGFPHLSLTVDPKDTEIMNRSPRGVNVNIISPWMKILIMIVSISGGVIAVAVFYYYWRTTGNLVLSRSVAFATLGINSLIYVFSVRTLTQPFWKQNIFGNKWLNIAVIVGLFTQILPFMTEGLRGFFEIQSLSIFQWAGVFTASLGMFFIIEMMKVVFRIGHIRE